MASIAGRLLVPTQARPESPYSFWECIAPLGVGGDEIHWENGVKWETAPCSPIAQLWEPMCVDDGPDTQADKYDDARAFGITPELDPFVVYSSFDCTTIGGVPASEARARARALLESGEEYAVARTLMTGEIGNEPFLAHHDTTNLTPADALNPVGAVSILESFLAENYDGRGVIHAAPAVLPYLCNANLVEKKGDCWFTCTGHKVIVAPGYSANIGPAADENTPGVAADPGESWMYATGEVYGKRSEIAVEPPEEGVVDIKLNNTQAVAERVYVVGWECFPAAARIKLTCCC